jgi:hypothetical protein
MAPNDLAGAKVKANYEIITQNRHGDFMMKDASRFFL